MKRTSRDEWNKRVVRWQASGLTAEEFAAELGIKAGTLRHWKWQLGWEARGKPPRASAKRPTSSVRRRRRAPKETVKFSELLIPQAEPPSPIEIVVDGSVVRVGPQFDEGVLRRVLAVVKGAA